MTEELPKRKYLNDLGSTGVPRNISTNEDRQLKWAKERAVYGFDERDTWSLDDTMVELLYERLMLYMEYADTFVDLEYHTFEIDGEEYTQRELILEMIELSRKLIQIKDELRLEESDQLKDRIWEIWHHIHPAMWW